MKAIFHCEDESEQMWLTPSEEELGEFEVAVYDGWQTNAITLTRRDLERLRDVITRELAMKL